MQREIVDPVLERHDPAVQQLVGPNPLAPEVVHEEHAADRLHVNRRLVEFRDRIEREVELIERQLAADHHHRTADAHPPSIALRAEDHARRGRVALALERFVRDRIEHGDRMPIDVDRVRQVHVAAQRAPHAFREHRFAVSGRPVEKDRLARVHGRAELLDHLVANDEV